MTLEVPIDGTIVRRSYTISATPSRPHVISITVKRVEGGANLELAARQSASRLLALCRRAARNLHLHR
jgi:ferredoxin-NADP reductase